jgi:hypothetical protein
MSSIPFTRATARCLPDGAMLDIFVGSRNGLNRGDLGPSAKAKAKKDHQIAREVLLQRGWTKEVLDYAEEN